MFLFKIFLKLACQNQIQIDSRENLKPQMRTSAIFYPEDGDSRFQRCYLPTALYYVTMPEDNDLHDHRKCHHAEIWISMALKPSLRKFRHLVCNIDVRS